MVTLGPFSFLFMTLLPLHLPSNTCNPRIEWYIWRKSFSGHTYYVAEDAAGHAGEVTYSGHRLAGDNGD